VILSVGACRLYDEPTRPCNCAAYATSESWGSPRQNANGYDATGRRNRSLPITIDQLLQSQEPQLAWAADAADEVVASRIGVAGGSRIAASDQDGVAEQHRKCALLAECVLEIRCVLNLNMQVRFGRVAGVPDSGEWLSSAHDVAHAHHRAPRQQMAVIPVVLA
jgi:hypothetical protein